MNGTENQYDSSFIQNSRALILKEDEESVTVGITAETTTDTIGTIKSFHRKKVIFREIPESMMQKYLEGESELETSCKDVHDNDEGKMEIMTDSETNVSIVNTILQEAVERKASDIHIETGESCTKIRFRMHGDLKTMQTLEKARFDGISTRIKIMANMNILEKRKPQDGRITAPIGNDKVDMRVSVIPTTTGESIVLRILGKSSSAKNLEELGIAPFVLEDIRKMISIPHGLIIVTGPTGSGKTTTLNAMLAELASDEKKIISIEDPVEFRMEGISQIQINDQIGLGFGMILRNVLRQDPNIIMVGEIRDRETAELCVRAALTGHLVLSTLHTNDALGAISRLRNLGIEQYMIASVLKGAVAQRLVKATGKGEKGRILIAESFSMTPSLEEDISDCKSMAQIEANLRKKGMRFLKDDAMDKISKNLTTREEILKEISL